MEINLIMDTNNTEIIIFEIKKYSKSDTIIIYDGDCPVCNNITLLSKIDKTSNSVDLLNAREVIPLVETLRNEFNININEGMAVVHNNDFYFAGEALHFLGTHSSKKYFFSNLINIIYKNKFISIKLYPLFKFFRSILLKLLRRKPL